ncbi:DUF4097 family beta strand repeat-containing protein [Haloarchaeobius sp. DFWS5]|uniref:DUF4097 family beta strand repeat-containing protein n=1 Tax=Haloarchaeobius sp. DFWS5 TaxID=3446114 RepID=UPI003EBD9443
MSLPTSILRRVGLLTWDGPSVSERETRTLSVDDGDALRIENRLGAVSVVGEDRADVLLDSEIRADSEELLAQTAVEATRHGDGIRVATSRPGWVQLGDVRVDLELRVPAELRVDSVETSSGDLDVHGTAGDPTVSASSGDVTVTDVAGAVRATASSGAVTIRAVDAVSRATASSGDIHVDVDGVVEKVQTNSGAITVEAERVARAEASSGTVRLRVDAVDADTVVSTSSGSVDLHAAAPVRATTRVDTSSGDVQIDGLGPSDGQFTSGTGVVTVPGDVAATLSIETSSGDVTVHCG